MTTSQAADLVASLDAEITWVTGPRRRELCQRRDAAATQARAAGCLVPDREPMIGERTCGNCRAQLWDHCTLHVLPCCPGLCPGPTWAEYLVLDPPPGGWPRMSRVRRPKWGP